MEKNDLQVCLIQHRLEAPTGQVMVSLEFAKGRAELLFDLGDVLVLSEVQNLTQVPVALLKEAGLNCGVEQTCSNGTRALAM